MDTLISTGTPKLRFPGFHDQWQQKRLGEAGSIISGLTYSPSDVCNTGTLVLRSSNVQNRRLTFEDNVYVNTDKGSFNPVKENDILICVRNGSRGLIGKNALVGKKYAGLAFGAFMAIFRSENNRFIFHILDTNKFKKEVHKNLGATINSINGSDLKKFKFSFPTTEEQELIACSLSLVDTWLDNLISQKENLELYKKGIVQKIFSLEIRLKDKDGKDFPDWENKRLSSFLMERNETYPKNDKYPLMAFVAYKGVAPKGDRYNREFLVNDSDNKKYKRTEYGDFIYSSNNLETGSIGTNRYGAATISPVYSIFKIKESCDYRFISSLLVRKSFINKILRYRQGVVYGQWRIHESDFLRIEEKIPCVKEQQKIAELMTSIDKIIELKQDQISEVENWKKGLLQQMFV